MTMDEVVEQVARAIIRRRAEAGDHLGPAFTGTQLDKYVDGAWQFWRDDARAAILATLKAVRVPTLEMQKAYFDSIDKHLKLVETSPYFGRFDNHRIAHRAMIDQAIAQLDTPSPSGAE